jgi:hypothetical protein
LPIGIRDRALFIFQRRLIDDCAEAGKAIVAVNEANARIIGRHIAIAASR